MNEQRLSVNQYNRLSDLEGFEQVFKVLFSVFFFVIKSYNGLIGEKGVISLEATPSHVFGCCSSSSESL